MQHRTLIVLVAVLMIFGSATTGAATRTSSVSPPGIGATANCSDSWRTIASRTVGPGPHAILYDTVALAPNNIWAVGSTSLIDTRYEVPLIMRWNGTYWEVVPTPAIAGDMVRLYGITAISPNDIWAVGAASTLSSGETVALHWNGTNWSRVATPNGLPGKFNALYDIDALATNDIWAVGNDFGNDGGQPIIAHWNGSLWAKIANPLNLDQSGHFLRGVTMIAANNAWAVGAAHDINAGGPATTLTLHWDGTAWSVVPSPNVPAGGENALYAVDALAANDIWAVGGGFYEPLALHWDGLSWSIQPLPDRPLKPSSGVLNSVIALTPNNIWAVGNEPYYPITFHWDGSAWTDVSPTNDSFFSETLYGVTAVDSNDIWAVGHINNKAYNDGPMLVRRFAPNVAFADSSFRRTASPDLAIPVALTSTAPYTVSVHYAVSDGSALAGVDYVGTSGTLQIPPCESTVSFPVALLDSPAWKPAAYANLTLDSPSGASLGSLANARLFTANMAQAPAGLAAFLPVIRTPISPIPSRIAYVGVSYSQSWDIYSMNADSIDRRQLTNNPAREYDPSWSPDGRRLAFVSERDGNPEIYVMNADGSRQTRLTVSPGEDVAPSWSPDGQRIVFASRRKGARLLFMMRSDGQAQTQLSPSNSSGDPNDLAPAWSPEGQQIAFTSTRGSSTYAEIYIINANGSGLRRLTSTPEEDTDPAWSPDGQTIAYASGYMPRYQLMSMHADGSQQLPLNPNFDTGGHPSWSPDGRSVVYDRLGSSYESMGSSIEITGITYAAPHNFGPQSYRELGPVWAPR